MAGGMAAAGAILMAVAMASLATPPDFDARLLSAQAKAVRAKALMRSASVGAYGPDAVCVRDPDDQATRLREAVTQAASGGGVTLESLDSRPEPAPQASARLTPVRVRFQATGPYEGVIGVLAVLSRDRPQIFVDSLDLTPKTANVTLGFSGRAFCSASL